MGRWRWLTGRHCAAYALGRQRSRLHAAISPTLDRAWPLGVSAKAEGSGFTFDGHTELVRLWPYHAQVVTVAAGNPVRIAHAMNPEYRIELWTTDGRLTRVVSRSNARRPPTEQEVADVEEAERCRVGVASFGRDYLLAIRQNEDGMILVEVLPFRRSS